MLFFFGNNIDNVNLNAIGPSIENNKLFTNKTNVEIVEIINTKKVKMRIKKIFISNIYLLQK